MNQTTANTVAPGPRRRRTPSRIERLHEIVGRTYMITTDDGPVEVCVGRYTPATGAIVLYVRRCPKPAARRAESALDLLSPIAVSGEFVVALNGSRHRLASYDTLELSLVEWRALEEAGRVADC